MATMQLKAQQVKDAGGIPARIGITEIIGLISSLVEMFKNCKGADNPARAYRMLKRGGPIYQIRLKQAIKDKFGKDVPALAKNVLTVSKETTQAEFEEMWG